MCGIVGIYDKEVRDIVTRMNRALECIARRGPDNQDKLFVDDNIVFGHARLSIIDITEAANQPYHYDYLSLVFNGEIYNYLELKDILIGQGYTFETSSDTEVLIKLIHCFGMKILNELKGMFAFGIYDKKSKDIYIVRDRFGVKPLFYSKGSDFFVFGSTFNTILSLTNQTDINKTAVSHFLRTGLSVFNGETIYSSIAELKAGHYLRYDMTTNVCESTLWFNPRHKDNKDTDLNSSALETILKRGFSYRMRSDVPVGVFLSGGIDSSLLLSLLPEGNDLNTYTVGFDEAEFDESAKAKAIAEELNYKNLAFKATPGEYLKILKDLPNIYEEPFADSSCLPTVFLAKEVSKHVKVALSADGGDELFGGYSHYFDDGINRLKRYKKLPSAFVHLLYNLCFRKMSFRNKYRMALMKDLSLLKPEIVHLYNTPLSHIVDELYKYDVSIKENSETIEGDWRRFAMKKDVENYLQNILRKVDRATMYYSVESREPFLDEEIYARSLKYDIHELISEGTGKLPLRKILYGKLNYENLIKGKKGFGIPVINWIKSRQDYSEYFDSIMTLENIRAVPGLDSNQVLKLISEFKSNQLNYDLDQVVWRIFMLLQWNVNRFKP